MPFLNMPIYSRKIMKMENEILQQNDGGGEYQKFVDKFKPKKTTDDCYTPPEVYEIVKNYALEIFPDWAGKTIVRPFYPGGDFENFDYPDGCVVIDNPPFSIYSKIVRWYCEKNIPFFLFAPALTVMVPGTDVTYITCNATVVYENGAVVNTSFVTNHPSEFRVMTAPELHERVKQSVKAKPSKSVRKIKYSPHITSGALLNKLPAHGIEFNIRKTDCKYIRKTGDGHQIFGCGLLLSTEARMEAEEARREAEEARAVDIPLSDQELREIARLDGKI